MKFIHRGSEPAITTQQSMPTQQWTSQGTETENQSLIDTRRQIAEPVSPAFPLDVSVISSRGFGGSALIDTIGNGKAKFGNGVEEGQANITEAEAFFPGTRQLADGRYRCLS